MGYQFVEAQFEKSQRSELAIAYNGELLVLASEPMIRVARESCDLAVLRAPSAAGEIRSLSVVPKAKALLLDARARESLGLRAAAIGSGPASDAPEEKAKSGEVFKRFVAYSTDIRLRSDGSWTDATYATTEDDAKNVKTGSEAVKRYALPNKAPASHVWTGKPNKDTKIKRGTVQPAFGEPGGGVEVIFPEGTQPHTVTGPEKINDRS